jgi:hypothetical protein
MKQDTLDIYLKGKIVKAATQTATIVLCKMDDIEFTQALQT